MLRISFEIEHAVDARFYSWDSRKRIRSFLTPLYWVSSSELMSVEVVSFTTCLFLGDNLLNEESIEVGTWVMKREGINDVIGVLVASINRKTISMDGILLPLSNR